MWNWFHADSCLVQWLCLQKLEFLCIHNRNWQLHYTYTVCCIVHNSGTRHVAVTYTAVPFFLTGMGQASVFKPKWSCLRHLRNQRYRRETGFPLWGDSPVLAVHATQWTVRLKDGNVILQAAGECDCWTVSHLQWTFIFHSVAFYYT